MVPFQISNSEQDSGQNYRGAILCQSRAQSEGEEIRVSGDDGANGLGEKQRGKAR
jgi:peptide methionine sulfoxide reductase MsrA